ncbi:hypothetical protein WHZ78_21180 [Bradyrhizobium symbiodeficiens]|uniref:hypothetical protein n=1 Tax=Bradyrhizobium symbiodeficiens TaxID=1404367 RepID=UPI0030CC9C40
MPRPGSQWARSALASVTAAATSAFSVPESAADVRQTQPFADLVILDRLIEARILAGFEILRDRPECPKRLPDVRCRRDVSKRLTVDGEIGLAPRRGVNLAVTPGICGEVLDGGFGGRQRKIRRPIDRLVGQVVVVPQLQPIEKTIGHRGH